MRNGHFYLRRNSKGLHFGMIMESGGWTAGMDPRRMAAGAAPMSWNAGVVGAEGRAVGGIARLDPPGPLPVGRINRCTRSHCGALLVRGVMCVLADD